MCGGKAGTAPVENALKRNAARLVLKGREAAIIRIALASKYAELFKETRSSPPRFSERSKLWEFVSLNRIEGRSFDFLEFGVFKGESISAIATLNPHPNVRLFGFDSFEGLPRDWMNDFPRGKFTLGGQIPENRDQRIQFIKGWFDQTLPTFLSSYVPQDQLWIHMDADLYGSSMTVLAHLNRYIQPGSLLMFDDFQNLTHDFKALCDFEEMSDKRFELISATVNCRQAAFVCR